MREEQVQKQVQNTIKKKARYRERRSHGLRQRRDLHTGGLFLLEAFIVGSRKEVEKEASGCDRVRRQFKYNDKCCIHIFFFVEPKC